MDREIVSATIQMYKGCAVSATKSLYRNLPLLAASVAVYAVFMIAVSFLGGMGMAGGLILGLLNVALLTFYYSWIGECVRKNRIFLKEYLNFDYMLFSAVINAAFILFIASFLLQMLTAGMNAGVILLCVSLGLFIFFNALPETLYIHGYNGAAAFSEAFRFVRDNWIEWFLPLLVFFLPVLIASPISMLLMFSTGDPLLPVLKFIQLFSLSASSLGGAFFPDGFQLLLTLLSLVAGTWFMIFRGFLYLALESGSRRQRAFRARQE